MTIMDESEVFNIEAPVDPGNPEEEEGKPPELIYDESSENLVPEFDAHPDGQIALRKLGADIMQKFNVAYEASAEYRQRFADDWRIWSGELKPKTGPLRDASNAHLPMMLENTSRLCNRAFGELFGDGKNWFSFTPNGPDDEKIAERLSLHQNWQVRDQMPEFRRQMHRATLMFFVIGDVTCHTYWDENLGRPCVEVLTPDEFVTPYVQVSVMPDWSDVPWKAKILNYYRHQLESYRGVWWGVDEVLRRQAPTWDAEPEQKLTETVSQIQGVRKEDEAGAPYKLIWYEGWEALPNQERQRYVQAVVDSFTYRVLSLRIHEQPNWQDRVRHDRQLAEFNSYQQGVAAAQAAQAEVEQLSQTFEQQMAAQAIGPEMASQVQAELDMKRQAMPPPPQPPPWLEPGAKGPKPPRMEPINLFSHGVCLEPLVGNLGLGFGRIQADLNRAANTAFQHGIDAASLANTKVLLTSDQISFSGGQGLEISPGKVNRVTGVTGGDLKNEIMEFSFQGPEPALFQATDKLMEAAQASIQAPGILSGEEGKSGETYRGVMARIEQATKNLAVTTRKLADMVETVLKHVGYINSVFLPDEEIVLLTNHLDQPEEVAVGRKMYERGYRVSIRADLRFATLAQRIAETDELLEMVGAQPMLQQNVPFIWHALKKSLEARGRHDMIPQLGPEPPPPETPLAIPPPAPPQAIDPNTGQPIADPNAAPPGAPPMVLQ